MRIKQDLKFAFHILFHPFDGFWDMKREKRGKVYLAISFIILWGFANIFSKQATSFLFRGTQLVKINFAKELLNVILISGLFCVSNWCVTTLMDGEGKMKDILMTMGYAALPVVIIQFPLAVISNFLSYPEIGYYNALSWASFAWFGILLFFGIMTIHQYTLLKCVFTIILTAAAMIFIAFLSMIFLNILSQMISLGAAVYTEIMLRTVG